VKIWDDTLDAPVGTDGKAALVGYLVSREQAERWQAAGFDIPAAVDRYLVFSRAWDSAASEKAADDMVEAFFADERQQALLAGIDAADPDFFRFAAGPKHYEFG
jgi:hypothetical protein